MVNSETEYPEVDLTPLLTPGVKFAVRCESEEEALSFLDAMMSCYPEKCRNWRIGDVNWDDDNEGCCGGRAYFPDINDIEMTPFQYYDMDYALEEGYTIVYFSELIVDQESIQESDMPFESLF